MKMQEHLRVVKTLEPLPADRRAFRLIGGVLVEKTVGEVLPAVQQQQEQLNQLILRLTDTITEKEKDLKKMQKEFDLQKERNNRESKSRRAFNAWNTGISKMQVGDQICIFGLFGINFSAYGLISCLCFSKINICICIFLYILRILYTRI